MQRSDIDNGIYTQYVNYFRDFAVNHIDLQHTISKPSFVSPEVDSGNVVLNMKSDVLAWLSPPEFDGFEPYSDNELLQVVGKIFFLKKVGDSKVADIEAAKNFCLLIALDLVAKMFNDKADPDTENQLVSHFTRNDYSIDPGSAEQLDKYYGVQLTFRLKAIVNLEFNPARYI